MQGVLAFHCLCPSVFTHNLINFKEMEVRFAMTAVFRKDELPKAAALMETARRMRPRRDGGHLFQGYFLWWAAFNAIYTAIAFRQGRGTYLLKREDGTVLTHPNGHVNIPQVRTISEQEQIQLCFDAFDDDLKQTLVLHDSTRFFVDRIPAWQGKMIEYDAFGQRVNGVIHVNLTTDSQYPVWSPIDTQIYGAYLAQPDNQADRDFLARQIVELLAAVRENLMHGGKKLDDGNDISVVEHALPLLALIVSTFIT